MSLTRTGFLSALKRKYEPRVAKLLNMEYPATNILPKSTDLGLEFWSLPVMVSGGQRIANDMPTAVAQSSTGIYRNFLIPTTYDYYGIADVSNKILEAGSDARIAEAYMTENDGVVHGIYESVEIAIFEEAGGTLGVVSVEPTENASTFVFTLAHATQAQNFEPGMMVTAHSANFGGTTRTSDGTDNEWVVAAVDTDAGTITVTGTYDSSGNIAADDVLQREGAHQTAIASAVNFPGFKSWIPASAPTSGDSFLNVDRSEYPTKLAGHRISGGTNTIEEAVIDAIAQVSQFKRKPTHLFLNDLRAAILCKELGSRAINDPSDMKKYGVIGYKGFVFVTAWGPIHCVPAHKCPYLTGWLITNEKKCIEIKSVGKLCKNPGITDMKAGFQLEGTDDNRTVWVSRPALGVKEPFAHARIDWDS